MEILSGMFSFSVLLTVFAAGAAVGICVSLGLVFLLVGVLAMAAGGSAVADANITKESSKIRKI